MKSPMPNDIESMLSEDVHYQIIPSDDKHGWDIRILEEFPETIIQYDAIELVENEEQISFNFRIVSTPDQDLSIEDLTLQEYAGKILNSLLEVAISEGTLVAEDKKTGERMATDAIHEELDNEYQFGTDDTEELTDE